MAGTLITERYEAAGVGRDGTLIASKEDLSVQHGDICHSMGQCYPILPLFLSLFHRFSLAAVSHLDGDQQTEGKETESRRRLLLCKSVNLAGWSEQLPRRADV